MSSLFFPAPAAVPCTASLTTWGALSSSRVGPCHSSSLAIYAAAARTLGSFSRSAPGFTSLPSALGRTSLSSPPAAIRHEAAGASEASEIDTATATFGPASLIRCRADSGAEL